MVIDVHYHTDFFEEICCDEEIAEKRRIDMAYYKTPVSSVERIFERLSASGVDKCVLLPHDYRFHKGDHISNEDMARLVEFGKGRFYGFASVEPDDPMAL